MDSEAFSHAGSHRAEQARHNNECREDDESQPHESWQRPNGKERKDGDGCAHDDQNIEEAIEGPGDNADVSLEGLELYFTHGRPHQTRFLETLGGRESSRRLQGKLTAIAAMVVEVGRATECTCHKNGRVHQSQELRQRLAEVASNIDWRDPRFANRAADVDIVWCVG